MLRTLFVAGALVTLVAVTGSAATEPKVYVYLSTQIRARELQVQLSRQLQGIDVTVYGRFRDFESALEANPPQGVISTEPVLEHFKLQPQLRGYTHESDSEDYVLLSPDKAMSAQAAAGLRIGVIDILGRRATDQWAAALLHANGGLQLTRVARTEDLIPLFSLETVDVLLVPEGLSVELRKLSKMPLHATPVAKVGLARLAPVGGGDVSVVAAGLRKLDPELNASLGVSSWR